MIGEEATRAFSTLNRDTIELIFKLLFKILERDDRRNMVSPEKEKTPKVKVGELSDKEYSNLLKKGENFRMIDVPTEKLDEIKGYAEMLGASYHFVENDNNSNTTFVAVSERSLHQFEDALKQAAKSQLSSDGVNHIKSENIIPDEHTRFVKDVLSKYEIPAFSFSDQNGGCINIVPKEYEGQYRAAMEEVKETFKSIENVKFDIAENAKDKIKDMTQVDDNSDFFEKIGNDQKFVVYDEEKNMYAYIYYPNGKSEVIETLENMGYDKKQTEAIISKMQPAFLKSAPEKTYDNLDEKTFDSNNAELSDIRYCIKDNSIAVIKAERNENDEISYKYVAVNNGASRNEIEAAIRKNLVKDEKSVTDIMKEFDREKAIPVPEQIVIPSLGYKVSLVSTQTYEISKDDISFSVQKGKADIPKIAEFFSISAKEAEKLISRSEKAINSVGSKQSFLSQLKSATASKGDKSNSERTPDISKDRESRSI